MDEILVFNLKRELKQSQRICSFYQSHRDLLLRRVGHLKFMLRCSIEKIEGAKRFGQDQMRKKIYLFLIERGEKELAEEVRRIDIDKKASKEEINTRWAKTIHQQTKDLIIENRQKYYEWYFKNENTNFNTHK